MANGVLVDIEAAVNVHYGYDIRGEVLGETGTIALAESSPIVVKREGRHAGPVPEDWRERFLRRLRHRVPGVDRRGGRRDARPARARGTATRPTVVTDAVRRGATAPVGSA